MGTRGLAGFRFQARTYNIFNQYDAYPNFPGLGESVLKEVRAALEEDRSMQRWKDQLGKLQSIYDPDESIDHVSLEDILHRERYHDAGPPDGVFIEYGYWADLDKQRLIYYKYGQWSYITFGDILKCNLTQIVEAMGDLEEDEEVLDRKPPGFLKSLSQNDIKALTGDKEEPSGAWEVLGRMGKAMCASENQSTDEFLSSEGSTVEPIEGAPPATKKKRSSGGKKRPKDTDTPAIFGFVYQNSSVLVRQEKNGEPDRLGRQILDELRCEYTFDPSLERYRRLLPDMIDLDNTPLCVLAARFRGNVVVETTDGWVVRGFRRRDDYGSDSGRPLDRLLEDRFFRSAFRAPRSIWLPLPRARYQYIIDLDQNELVMAGPANKGYHVHLGERHGSRDWLAVSEAFLSWLGSETEDSPLPEQEGLAYRTGVVNVYSARTEDGQWLVDAREEEARADTESVDQ
ncbi:unnamed protein product [Vitrella brassicaformis CCMP3155]|uniref:Uncharacterized protein n=2 Tax=Vitrella brassicaformis TaxID=1169539 RepID=A0A0G4EVJ7_VITBC|nr:unnamed protein product [Vitrella brassicaformis CCMP3155]|eukprot:CEM02105.1 unnamed protein product [Vitrella brassicaformis CCMP3155]